MTAPIQMIIHCPECRARHIDEGDFATKPHHTHSCQSCGLTWRHAVVPTVGVQFLPGFKNDPTPVVSAMAGDTEAEGDERQLVHFLELHSPSSKFIRRIIARRDARIAELEKRAVEPASLRFLLNHAPTCALLRSFAGLYTAPQAVCDCGAKDKHPNAGFMFNAKPAQPAASVKPKGNQWDDEKPGWSTMPSSDIPPPVDEPQAKVAWDARDTAVKFMERHGLPFAEARIREPMCELLIEVRETGAREAYEAVLADLDTDGPSQREAYERQVAQRIRALATSAAAKAGS